jgi:hypothetical protein
LLAKPIEESGRVTDAEIVAKLGPLAALAGVFEGDQGVDEAPSAARTLEQTPYRERATFEPMGPVDNHEQVLLGLRYAMTAWRLGEEDPFHEERGYWLWDAEAKQVLRCFVVPRGVTLTAGGTVEPDATSFELAADVGSETYGICSNLFLDREFKSVRYELAVSHTGDGFDYRQDTQLQLKGRSEIFHHTDQNSLVRVG